MGSSVRLGQGGSPFPWGRRPGGLGGLATSGSLGAETPLQPRHLWHPRKHQLVTYLLPCSAFTSAPVREALQKPKRVAKPYGQGPTTLESLEQPTPAQGSCTDTSAAAGSAETAIQDVGLGGRNAGLGGGEPVLAKCP